MRQLDIVNHLQFFVFNNNFQILTFSTVCLFVFVFSFVLFCYQILKVNFLTLDLHH